MLRWDTLLIAGAVAGGSMLIETSHRIDTGAPDEEVVASAPADCTAVAVAYDSDTVRPADEGSEVAREAVPTACPER